MPKKVIINSQKGTKNLYDKIASSRFFEGEKELTMSLIFCIAVAVGYKENKYQELSKKEWLTRTEFIDRNSDMKTFLEAVAVAHIGSLKVLSDDNKVYEIAEAYANEGIKRLHFSIFTQDSPDFDKVIEGEIKGIAQKKKFT